MRETEQRDARKEFGKTKEAHYGLRQKILRETYRARFGVIAGKGKKKDFPPASSGPLALCANGEPEADRFPIVGIGAGCREACRLLLGASPLESGCAFVSVQHLDPQHDSALTAGSNAQESG